MSYYKNRHWSDQFIPQIKNIVGPMLLIETPDEIDMQQAADLMIFTARNMRIAARVRRYGYADKFPNQFTIRYRLASGTETEFSKIMRGFGDWLFYGHDGGDGTIMKWLLVDLAAFRKTVTEAPWDFVHGERGNGDGTYFKWYNAATFQKTSGVIIASHGHDDLS